MKAWIVREKWGEGSSVIVFAETRGKARSEGASELDRDYMEVSINREARYDQYADKGEVPLEVLLKDGWWWTCKECDRQVTQVDIDYKGAKIISGVPYCGDCVKEREVSNNA